MPVSRTGSAVTATSAILLLSNAGPVLAGASPFGVATPDSSGSVITAGPFSGILLWAIHLQTRFYSGLTDALSNMTTDGHAAQWLLGLSFLYGIFHAVGPGHGKAVISAYLLATGDSLKRGVALSFAAAFVQAVSAIVIVSVAAILLNMTAVEMTHVTDLVEIGSYASIMGLGMALLISRSMQALRPARPAASGRFICEAIPAGCFEAPEPGANIARRVTAPFATVTHGVNCACAAAVQLMDREDTKTWPGYLSAIVSVGIRPCSGALIVLVFALSQQIFAAGVLSVFAMAVGTGLTVMLIAISTVFARSLLMRGVSASSTRVAAVSKGLQVAAALAFFLFGLTMTIGALEVNGLI